MNRLGPIGLAELAGAVTLSLAFGSIYAFSVLMAPLESTLRASRGQVSAIYSLAIAALTVGVFAAPHLMRLRPAALAMACGVVAAIGIVAIAIAPSLWVALAGYGLLFGFSNGVAYSLFLARAISALPKSPGIASGIVTAAYSLGAAIAAQLLALALEHWPLAVVLLGLSGSMVAAGGAASLCFIGGNSGGRTAAPTTATSPAVTLWLWIIFLLGASGGLMVIAHASGLMPEGGKAGLAPTVTALGYIAGSLVGGFVAGARPPSQFLAIPLALLALAFAGLLFVPSVTVAALALCGAAYGWLAAVVPVAVRRLCGEQAFSVVFGRVFTAWGVAGLAAPSLAGVLFDFTGGYGLALSLAMAGSVAAVALALMPPDPRG